MCQLFLKAKQQSSKARLTRLPRVLDAGRKGVYAVDLTNEQREKENEMLKTLPRSSPNKVKGKGNRKDNRGGEMSAK